MNWNIDVADCHQFSAEPGEVHIKYVSPDGKKEAIYHDENHGGTLVTDPRDIGTYNYAPHVEKGISDEIGHFVYDVLPWFLWGNSADDTTTMTERVTAFCFGWINRI